MVKGSISPADDTGHDSLVYTALQAAEAIGVGERRMYELVAGGLIPAIKWGPKQIVIPRRSLAQFLDEEAVRQQQERFQPIDHSPVISETFQGRQDRRRGTRSHAR